MSKNITILGAGVSGRGAALLARRNGFEVFVSDMGEVNDDVKNIFAAEGVDFESGTHSESRILRSDLIIKSPGIPFTAPVVHNAIEQGIPVIDELEFAARFTDAPIVLITGSNGKTTTTLLTEHLLNACGLKAVAVGNVGKSFAETVAVDSADVWVVEASSFQLDGMKDIRARISVLLNITPDHINWYGSMDRYAASKLRIADMLETEGIYIYNADNNWIPAPGANSNKRGISLLKEMDAWLEAGQMKFQTADGLITFDTSEMMIKGPHNAFNAMAAIWVALLLDCELEGIREGLATFRPVSHRLERVARIGEVEFVNDSKATNTDSVEYALRSFDNPMVWIAGGIDKGNDYSTIRELASGKVRALVCLGTDNRKLHSSFSDIISSIEDAGSMKEAVKKAWVLAEAGDTVLLSPACASFDLFDSYEDRGEQFRKQVLDLDQEMERRMENA